MVYFSVIGAQLFNEPFCENNEKGVKSERGDHDVSRETFFFYNSDDQFVKIKRIVESASHESLFYKHFFPSYNFEIFSNPHVSFTVLTKS